MLILSRKPNESIMIGDQVQVSIIDIRGDQVKLGIRAPREVKVYRQEVYQAIQTQNREALRAGTQLPQIDTMLDQLSEPGEKENEKPPK